MSRDLSQFLVLAFWISAIVTWASIFLKKETVRRIFKPLTLAILVGWTLYADRGNYLLWGALGFSLAGDIFLMFRERYFMHGLISFFLAHVLYIALVGAPLVAVLMWGAGVLLLSLPLITKILLSIQDDRLKIPVALYMMVLVLLVAACFSKGYPALMLGAFLFYVSDALLGWEIFVSQHKHLRLMNMIAYHGAQFLLFHSLLSA